jgi:hypothetical protein
MTIRNVHPGPCWQVNTALTGETADDGFDGWSHYETKAEADADIVERFTQFVFDDALYRQSYPQGPFAARPELVAGHQFDAPCVQVVCDGCSDVLDGSGDGWTHFDPNENPPMVVGWDDVGWVETGDGRHFHDKCVPSEWCRWTDSHGHDFADGECEQCGATPTAPAIPQTGS